MHRFNGALTVCGGGLLGDLDGGHLQLSLDPVWPSLWQRYTEGHRHTHTRASVSPPHIMEAVHFFPCDELRELVLALGSSCGNWVPCDP